MTQRSASSRLDLPQPFGPTMPVRPGSIRSSVGSTNDLKPDSLSRLNFMCLVPNGTPQACAPSGSKRRIDYFSELLNGLRAAQHLPVDEECRRRLHPELFSGAVADFMDAFCDRLVLQAGIEAFPRESGKLRDLEQFVRRIAHRPFFLLLEEDVDQRVIFVLRRAARQHEGRKGEIVEREFPENKPHLARV